MDTPWGRADTVSVLAEGIVSVSTCSHGGFILSPERNQEVPAAFRALSFKGQGQRGIYEWDVDACMVVLTFPELFDVDDLAAAKRIYDGCLAPKLVAVKLPPKGHARIVVAVVDGWARIEAANAGGEA